MPGECAESRRRSRREAESTRVEPRPRAGRRHALVRNLAPLPPASPGHLRRPRAGGDGRGRAGGPLRLPRSHRRDRLQGQAQGPVVGPSAGHRRPGPGPPGADALRGAHLARGRRGGHAHRHQRGHRGRGGRRPDARRRWITRSCGSPTSSSRCPSFPLLLLVFYLFRDSLKKALGPEAGVFVLIVVVIGGLRWMPVARLVRAQFLSLREKEFVEAARSLGARAAPAGRPPHPAQCRGAGHRRRRPSTSPPPSSPNPRSRSSGSDSRPTSRSWGRILYDAKDNLDFAPHWAIFPGTAIFLTVLSINFIGDGLRDALDPRKVLASK